VARTRSGYLTKFWQFIHDQRHANELHHVVNVLAEVKAKQLADAREADRLAEATRLASLTLEQRAAEAQTTETARIEAEQARQKADAAFKGLAIGGTEVSPEVAEPTPQQPQRHGGYFTVISSR
jgi:NADH dehydrogenase/NADH:ubiquinone oxidoreductase subunit G